MFKEKLKNFLSITTIYRHNFQTLHWKITGDEWDTVHSVMESYTNVLNDNIDKIGEMCLQLDIDPPSILESLDMASKIDLKIVVLKTSVDYRKDDCWKHAKFMLDQLIEVITDLKESRDLPSSFISILDDMENYFSLESDYKIKSRLK